MEHLISNIAIANASKCRWNPFNSSLALQHLNKLNFLDIEKQKLELAASITVEGVGGINIGFCSVTQLIFKAYSWMNWRNQSPWLAISGSGKNVVVYDYENKIIAKTLVGHTGKLGSDWAVL